MENSPKMLLNNRKTWFRLILAVFCCAFFSGCVSASLDDVGLENSNRSLSAPAIQNSSVQNNGPLDLDATDAAETEIATPDNATLPLQVDNTPSQQVISSPTEFTPGTAPNRDVGIAEIRAKAAATGNNAPNINDTHSGGGQHFTADELKLKKALLRAEAQAAQGLISEADLAQKRAQIVALRKKAGVHYKQAVRQISK